MNYDRNEYSEYNEVLNDLYAKVEAGEMTEEEACKKMWSVDKIWMAPDPREPHDVPDDYIPPSSNCLYDDSRDFNSKVRCKS